MWQLADQLGAITKPNSSDRAATAAWQLFNPMHVDAHTQICSASNEGEGISLAGSIATAMCEMKDTAEMAMLWLEVSPHLVAHGQSSVPRLCPFLQSFSISCHVDLSTGSFVC